ADGSGVLFGSLYVGAFFKNPGNETVSNLELCDSYMDAYNNNTNCGFLPGSFREIGACQVLADAEGPENSRLLKLEYFANTENGTVLYAEDEGNGECSCICGQGQEAVIGIDYQGSCNCFCEPQDAQCQCLPPTEDLVVTETTKYYSNSVLVTVSGGSSIEFTDFPQLELLDIFECNTNVTVYNETSVCPGLQSQAFSDLLTDFPSVAPTEMPNLSFHPSSQVNSPVSSRRNFLPNSLPLQHYLQQPLQLEAQQPLQLVLQQEAQQPLQLEAPQAAQLQVLLPKRCCVSMVRGTQGKA
ncbi:MAG: hypothetical protein SGILL_005368, partial [Bacillariaceae sp.]